MSFNYRFSVIPAGAIIDKRLTPRALQVLCLLGRHTNDAGWCSRSQVKMARELDCGRATVYDALELLVETGWIEKKANGRGGRAPKEGEQPFAAYSYRVVLDRETLPAQLAGEDQDTSAGVDRDSQRQEGAGIAAGGAGIAAGGAGIAAGGAGPEAAPLEGTLSEGISPEPERETARARDHEKFAKWLSAFTLRWPTAAADDQARIANAARGLSEAERNDALERIPAFLEHLQRLKRKHVPAGWRYLEEKRWTLLETEKSKPAAAQLNYADEGSVQHTIWLSIFRIARAGQGFPSFLCSQGRVRIYREMPEAMLSLAEPSLQWREVEEGSKHFAAWLRWLMEAMPSNFIVFGRRGGKRTLNVPDDWPPRKDGSLGPPGEAQSAA